MTNQEVVNELREAGKQAYSGVMEQARFSYMLGRIEDDRCKPKTIQAFFAMFGYTGKYDQFEKMGVTEKS